MTITPSEAPIAAIGNLRFTQSGVYAEYLVSGLPFIFLPKESQDLVADVHAELLRTLPSGALLSGLTAPVATRNITRRMIYAHPDLHPDNAIDATDPARTRRRLGAALPAVGPSPTRPQLTSPHLLAESAVGLRPAGATAAGGWQRRLDSIIGRDKDSAAALAHYRQLAATMVAKLPPALFAKPVSVEQIWWHWNYTASRHAWQKPIPNQPYNPHARLPGSAFTPVWIDPSAAALRQRRWRAARTEADIFLRTYRHEDDGVADSYQVIVGLEK